MARLEKGKMKDLQGKMKDLLGIKIVELGRTFIHDDDECYPLEDTLLLKTENEGDIQLLKTNQEDLYIDNNSVIKKPIISPELELEEGEVVIFKKIHFKDIIFPFKVESIMEFWVGNKNQEFLAGFILYQMNKNNSLCICVETDEIEVLSYNQLYERVQNYPFYYGTLTVHWYEK